MAAPYSCRYEHLSRILAAVDDAEVMPVLPDCPEPAAYATHLRLVRDGLDQSVYVRQCIGHDRDAHPIPGHVLSTALAAPRSPWST